MRPRRFLSTIVSIAVACAAALAVSPASSHAADTTAVEVRGGMSVLFNGTGRCTVGFTVTHSGGQDGFVTGSWCGQVGDSVQTTSGELIGYVNESQFPTRLWLYVELVDGATAVGEVLPNHPVRDGVEAPVGASVCKSASTTGVQCGTILSKNETITTPGGTYHGLTRTNVCAEPGESGAPFFSGGSAQGILVDIVNGNCSSGGVSYFYPLNRIFDEAPWLQLITS